MVDHNLLQRKKLFLFDLDGTLYLGDRLFEGVRELLSAIRARGFTISASTAEKTDAITSAVRSR